MVFKIVSRGACFFSERLSLESWSVKKFLLFAGEKKSSTNIIKVTLLLTSYREIHYTAWRSMDLPVVFLYVEG